MNNYSQIIPGILEKDWVEIEKKIQLVSSFAKKIHIDLIDGKFAPNVTFLDPMPFTKYTGNIEFELHMMVEEPLNFLKPFAAVGFRRFIGHIEKMSDQAEFVAEAQLLGDVSLAVDLLTPIESIEVPFEDLDGVLVMSVKAGESGQEFVQEILSKIEKIKNKTFIPIEIDGGINLENIVKAKESGVSRFVITSSIFNGSESENYNKLKSKILGEEV
ncbi:MAG: hypothetical protein AAB675_02580 [Patescibacteria group bacterium]